MAGNANINFPAGTQVNEEMMDRLIQYVFTHLVAGNGIEIVRQNGRVAISATGQTVPKGPSHPAFWQAWNGTP